MSDWQLADLNTATSMGANRVVAMFGPPASRQQVRPGFDSCFNLLGGFSVEMSKNKS